MYKYVIFIDFENLQKIDVSQFDSKVKIIVMVGLNQDIKVYEFVKNLLTKISSIELIKVNGQGPNALDFFIAFYIGKYFDNIKESEIIIYSKDTGYDQLIKHLDGYGISIKRIGLNEKTTNKTKTEVQNKQQIIKKEKDDTKEIVEYLQKQTTKKIGNIRKLFIYTFFSKNFKW